MVERITRMALRFQHGCNSVERETLCAVACMSQENRNREILTQIIHGSPIPIFVIDQQHRITHCNKAYERLAGASLQEIIGSSPQRFAKRKWLAEFIVDGAGEEEISSYYGDRYSRSFSIEGAYEAEEFFPAIGERGRWLFFTAAPLMDSDGRVIGAIETLQDVTERKLAEEAFRKVGRRFRAMLDFAPYPVLVYTLDGLVTYLNPAFTETFGWSLKEMEGKSLSYVPPGLEENIREHIRTLLEQRVILRRESKRLTSDGRLLDVILREVVFSEPGEKKPSGVMVILRDVTQERRIARQNEAMLRISMALPRYPDLEDVLDYINSEVKDLLGAEGSVVVLLDEHKQELFILGASYDNTDTQERIKEIRFSMDQLIAGRVIRSGEPMIVSDTSKDREVHEERDRRLGYKTRNLLLVPLKSSERSIGALCAINKKEGDFDQTDVELLGTIAGTVVLSVENARFSDELKKAYREVSSLNRAKDKAINHLSHELKTPVSILSSCTRILERSLLELPHAGWKTTMERMRRNLERILEIQYEAADIMENRPYKAHALLSKLLDQCVDELEVLTLEECGESAADRVRKRIDEIFLPREVFARELLLDEEVKSSVIALKPRCAHRDVEIVTHLGPAPPILIPPDVLHKVIEGLVRNAVENTPDEGKVEIVVREKGEGAELLVRDYGTGISEEAQRRIFEGLFTTRDTLAYSSKRPFDFMAGGKGADLLRMKIFSERHHFLIGMTSTRCRFIPGEEQTCPGRISSCIHCSPTEGCPHSVATTFTIYFPHA